MTKEELEAMVAKLEETGDYCVLRRLVPRTGEQGGDGTPTRTAIVLDVETTGLDPRKDEIIELSMMPFRYTKDGQIAAVLPVYDRLRQPNRPISAKIATLTGIDDAMVAGKVIDPDDVATFIAPACLVIAHNAAFDRKFAERLCPAFAEISWACSMTQAQWDLSPQFDGLKLRYLLGAAGLFHDGHRGQRLLRNDRAAGATAR